MDKDRTSRFLQVLRNAGYPGPSAREVLGREVGLAHLRMDVPLYLRRLAAPTPLNTLVKLFALGVEVAEADASAGFEGLGLDGAIALGLVKRHGPTVGPLVGISTCDELLLAHDGHNVDASNLRPDYVLGINPAAMALANLTLRQPVRSALDVGTGSGIQALLAAQHCEHVIGVDTNTRALDFARFNARLNRIENVEFRLGSLFEPVADERFDLIVSNPPYVISPETKYQFRDSGLPGDTICEAVIRQAHAHLNDGGFACILCNWALKENESWAAPLTRWVEGNGCDAWLLHTSTQDPLTYAALWTRDRDPRIYEEALERWMKYYSEQGIASIGLGAVILRRRVHGPNWIRPEDLPKSPVASCSDLIQSVFESEDFLSGLDDGRPLLAQRFRCAGDHRIRQTFAHRNGRTGLERVELQWERGFPFQAEVDALTLEMISQCDGHRCLGEILAALEKRNAANTASFVESGQIMIRRLLALGLLVPAQ